MFRRPFAATAAAADAAIVCGHLTMRRREAGFSAAAGFLTKLALFKANEVGTVHVVGTVYMGGTARGVGTVHVGCWHFV